MVNVSMLSMAAATFNANDRKDVRTLSLQRRYTFLTTSCRARLPSDRDDRPYLCSVDRGEIGEGTRPRYVSDSWSYFPVLLQTFMVLLPGIASGLTGLASL